MNDLPRQKLQELISQYGRSLCDDPRRCEVMLKDLCPPECKREITLLISALCENVPAELIKQTATLPIEAIAPQLTKRLYDHVGMAEEFSYWAVESWALALGLIRTPLLAARQSSPPSPAAVSISRATKILTQCSNCLAKFKVDAERIGKKLKCPKCQNMFTVFDADEIEILEDTAPTATSLVSASGVPLEHRPRPLQPRDFFETQHARFLPEKANSVNASITYVIEGDGGGAWTVTVKNGRCDIREGADPTASTQVKMSAKTYLQLAMGKLDAHVVFMLGRIMIKGDTTSAKTIGECFRAASREEIA